MTESVYILEELSKSLQTNVLFFVIDSKDNFISHFYISKCRITLILDRMALKDALRPVFLFKIIEFVSNSYINDNYVYR